MADTSVGERIYIAQGIEQNIRTDGRSRSNYRLVELEPNVIAQADGSARLHLGSTDVLIGVKVCQMRYSSCAVVLLLLYWVCPTGISYTCCCKGAWRLPLCCRIMHQVELGAPESSAPNQGQVHVSVECSSCASPEFKVCIRVQLLFCTNTYTGYSCVD